MATGAFDRFRDEVRAGLRQPHEPMDALYHAAACDGLGLERLFEYRKTSEEGLLYCASMWFEESERYLRQVPETQAAA